jgi:hypothetical protein
MKKQSMHWEKIFANHTPNKELISKICKEFNLITRKLIAELKEAKTLNRHFLREGIQMAIRHMNKCSIPVIIKEMQIKSSRLSPPIF